MFEKATWFKELERNNISICDLSMAEEGNDNSISLLIDADIFGKLLIVASPRLKPSLAGQFQAKSLRASERTLEAPPLRYLYRKRKYPSSEV